MNSITDRETSEDLFNLSSYIKGLADFTSKCQTPMTIALQGSWGSGKSSMMNLLEDSIKKNENNAIFVHFNTWQYSQFQFTDNLSLIFLSGLIEKISDVSAQALNKIALQTAAEAAKNTIKVIATLTGGPIFGQLLGGVIDSVEKGKKSYDSERQSVVKLIENLKRDFADLVKEQCETEENKDRIIFFIDDLDRLQPEKAVELMEILKIIIECESCVFVLAIDYEVVSRGVRAKYGQDITESKVKNFFDKIIQVPFALPVSKYDLSNYIKELIAASDLDNELKEIKTESGEISSDYIDMIRLSIGGNPRSIKRLLNTFRLLSYIIKGSNNVSYPILFDALCLQLAYEKVYNYLLENCDSKEALKEFFNLPSSFDSLKTSDPILSEKIGLKEYTDLEQENLRLFLEKFYNSIIDDKNEEITDDLAEIIKHTLFTSVVTATTIDANSSELKFDTKIEDIYATVKYIKEKAAKEQNFNSKLIIDAKKVVAGDSKKVTCVSNECTRELGINSKTFEDYITSFLYHNDTKLINAIIQTNKNKRFSPESIREKFNSLL